MSFIHKLQKNFIKEKQVYDLSRNEEFAEFNFVGFKETNATIDFVACVRADKLTERQIVNLRDSFFNITQTVSYDFGLKPLARNPNGLLCFVFEDNLPNHLANFIKKQTKISNFKKSAVIVSWAIDIKNKQIYTHNNLVSLFPPVYIVEGWVFPGLDYLKSFLYTYNPQSVHTENNAEVSLQSFESLETEMKEVEKTIKSTLKYQTQRYPKDERISIVIQNITMTKGETSKVSMNFHAPVYGAAGNVEGNQVIYASEQKQTLAQAADEIQKLLKQLEQTNPTATPEQQQAYVDAAISPTIKQRCVGALKAGVETGIEEFFDNSYVNVGKAVVKGWLKPE